MDLLLPTLANGLVLGSIYSVMAFGLAIVFGVMRVINFAHGVIAVLAAYVAFQLFQSTRLDPFLSLGLTVPLFFALGWLIHRLLIARLGANSESASMVVTFGLGISIEVLIIMIWTANFRSISPDYATEVVVFGPVRLSFVRLLAMVIAVTAVVLLVTFLGRSKTGKGIRAVIQDREAATYVGIDVEKVAAFTFGIAIASVAIGGTLLGTVYAFYPAVHLDWIGRLFAIVVLGGMGSIVGAFFAAYIVAIVETFVSLAFGTAWSPLVSFSVIILVLLIRPGGLAGLQTLRRA